MKALCFTFTFLWLYVSCDFDFKKNNNLTETPLPDITGSWKLLFLKGEDLSGRIHYPYDKKAEGFLVFDEYQNYAIQFYDATRPRLENKDPYFGTNSELRIAFLSGCSSFGKYKHTRDSITLEINMASISNRSSDIFRNYYELHGDTLLMMAPWNKLAGVTMTELSVWIRINHSD